MINQKLQLLKMNSAVLGLGDSGIIEIMAPDYKGGHCPETRNNTKFKGARDSFEDKILAWLESADTKGARAAGYGICGLTFIYLGMHLLAMLA